MLDCNTNPPRPRLSDILANDQSGNLQDAWNHTEAATDFLPLPPGTYTARVLSGELFKAKSGTPGYKLTFRVLEGEHAGRQFWHDLWLTPAALPMTKRDLCKLDINSLEQLNDPLPVGKRCTVQLAVRRTDDGTEYNRVRSFDVIDFDDDPAADPDFAPNAPKGGGGAT